MNKMLSRDTQPGRDPQLGPFIQSPLATTQAAEDLPRFRWTVAQIDELTRLGIFDEHARFELIGGEIVPMQSKGARHERTKMRLNRHLANALSTEIDFIPERSGYLKIRLSNPTSCSFRAR